MDTGFQKAKNLQKKRLKSGAESGFHVTQPQHLPGSSRKKPMVTGVSPASPWQAKKRVHTT